MFIPPPRHLALQATISFGLTAISVALTTHPAWRWAVLATHVGATVSALAAVDCLRQEGIFGQFGFYAPELYWLLQSMTMAASNGLLAVLWGVGSRVLR